MGDTGLLQHTRQLLEEPDLGQRPCQDSDSLLRGLPRIGKNAKLHPRQERFSYLAEEITDLADSDHRSVRGRGRRRGRVSDSPR